MGQEQTLGVFWVANAIIQQIPIQAVGPPFSGVTTAAALPTLMTYSSVMEIKLTLPDNAWFATSTKRYGFGFRFDTGKINSGDGIGEVVRRVCGRPMCRHESRPKVGCWELDAFSQTRQKSQVIRNIRLNPSADAVIGHIRRSQGDRKLFQFGDQAGKIDEADFVNARMSYTLNG